jgi:colicin import membrane protein
MADIQRNGVNGSMSEQKESSVLFSLKELMSIEENRIKEEADDKRRQEEATERARLDEEERQRNEAAARLAAEEERRKQEELRRKMEEAQIEAAKMGEVEKRKLEEQHRLRMQELDKQKAAEIRIAEIQASQRKGVHPGILAAAGLLLLAAIFAVVYFVSIKPASDAAQLVKEAQTLSASKDPSDWKTALAKLQTAQTLNNKSEGLQESLSKVQGQIKADEDARQAKVDELMAQIKTLQTASIDAAQKEKLLADLQAKLQEAQSKKPTTGPVYMGGGGRPPGPSQPQSNCPPGVPNCN